MRYHIVFLIPTNRKHLNKGAMMMKAGILTIRFRNLYDLSDDNMPPIQLLKPTAKGYDNVDNDP
jgi:hypothetical protein